MGSHNNFNCKIHAYNVRIRTKRHRIYEPTDCLYYALKMISEFEYNAQDISKEKRRKIGAFNFAIDFSRFEEKNEDLTRIDFVFGREVKESFPLKNKQGHLSHLDLPEGSNLCFNTHGSFLFKKLEEEWCCILFLERRFHTTGLSLLIKYLQKIKPNYSIDLDPITTGINYIKKIKSIQNLRSVIIKNQDLDLSSNDKSGTILRKTREKKKYEAKNIEIKILEGETTWEKVKSLIKDYFSIEKDPTNKDVRRFVDETEFVLIKKFGGKVDLFKNIILYKLKVKNKPKLREIDSKDFFQKFYYKIDRIAIDKIFKLSRKLNNHE